METLQTQECMQLELQGVGNARKMPRSLGMKRPALQQLFQ